ncbi:MAG: hypothetical protein EZS28_016645 [Streblomastix strix]|uniref:DUF4817 domain-containing protein n=1 Tax=Streblomastix strix TaxID=222440 RepID=A0A5J4VZ48_9EUKA|nr:MAG: hypothetical protein EZS28_016645 [Streblomastix strix]
MRAFENQHQLDPAIQPPEKQPKPSAILWKRSEIILSEFIRTGLSRAKIILTRLELDTLELSFRVSPENGKIIYLEFIHVDSAFGAPPYMEMIPYLETQPASLRAFMPARSPDLAEHTVELAQKTMDQIITNLKDKSTKYGSVTHLKLQKQRERERFAEFMKDYDPLRTGLIARNRFISTLTLAKVEMSDREFEMLVDRFTDPNKRIEQEDFHQKSIGRSIKERIYAVKQFYKAGNSASILRTWPWKNKPDRRFIPRTVLKFEKTGSILDKTRKGRKKTATNIQKY